MEGSCHSGDHHDCHGAANQVIFRQTYKGSHPERKVQFFLTLFEKPLTPPPLLFEHHVVNFLSKNFK